MRIYVDVSHWEKTSSKDAIVILKKMPKNITTADQLPGKEIRPLTGGFNKYRVEKILAIDPLTIHATLIPWPECDPQKKRYANISAAHRTLQYLEKKLKRTMDMYECDTHWHVIIDKNEPSQEEYRQQYMADLRKHTTSITYHH